MALFWLFLIGSLLPNCCVGDQANIDYMSENLDIEYFVINNLLTYDTFVGELRITNNGIQTVTDLTWSLYFTSVRLFEPRDIRPDGAPLGNTNLMVYHINGFLHRIAPTPQFQGFQALETLVIPFEADFFHASATETMPNWYFVDDVSSPRIAVSTQAENMDWIGPFDTPNQWKRSVDDTYNPYTAEDRYDAITYEDLGASQNLILPSPVENGLDPQVTVTVTPGIWVVVPQTPELDNEAQFLATRLGLSVVDPGLAPSSQYIELALGTVLDGSNQPLIDPETYRLDVIGGVIQSISIVGTDTAGAFFGVQSLISMFSSSRDIPTGYVVDYPRYPYRSIHIDVSRNFYSKDDVLKLLDIMSFYKLNKFSFHLTDDEGWRLEIPSIPELTEVGSRRCHDPSGDICLQPQLGSGPFVLDPANGFYSVADYREILTYANERHIQVIPEFDGPGHGLAAINAMNARFRKYQDSDPIEATRYLLIDPDDQSDYLSTQYYTDNAINPCRESTYDFFRTVIQEVKQMHSDIQPLSTFHFGGDEVPSGAWTASPLCTAISSDTSFLKEYYVRRIAEIAASEGLDVTGWEDGFMSSGVPFADLPTNFEYAYAWENTWEWGGGEAAYVLANAGFKTVLASATHLYFDHPTEPDPYERGLFWATRIAPLIKTFGFMPDDLYENIDFDVNGNPLDRESTCAMHGCTPLTPGSDENIIGMQGHMWSETIRGPEQFANNMFPRLLAMAERAWHRAEWELITDPSQRETAKMLDFQNFTNTLGYKELSRLDAEAVKYGITPPGARVSSNILTAKSEIPGLPIYYSEDEGNTWTRYEGPVLVSSGNLQIVTRSTDSVRSSRVVEILVP